MATKPKKANKTTVIVIKDKPKSEVGYKRPPKHTQFKKGQPSANPGGIPKHKRAMMNFNRDAITEAINITMTSTEAEIKMIMDHPDTPIGYKTILRAMLDASEDGNYSKFYEIAEHVIGKLASKVDVTSGGKPLGEAIKDREQLRTIMKEIEDEH